MATTEPKTEKDVPQTTANVAETKTVKVSNVSIGVTEKDIREFFSFSGNIYYIEMKSESETTQHAFVTFVESQGANTALLLTGAKIGDLSVSLSLVENYQLPAGATPYTSTETEFGKKAEEVVSTMLAKGYILGKDALQKAKSFDEKHQISSNASATAVSIDKKMGLTDKMKEVDNRYQVSEKTKSAVAVAEQKASEYVSNGAVWVAGAFAAVAKTAEGVQSKTKEKVQEAEEGSKTSEKVQKAEGSNKDSPATPVKSSDEKQQASK